MTERQIILHFEACTRSRNRERADALIDINLAFAGGQEAEQHRQGLL